MYRVPEYCEEAFDPRGGGFMLRDDLPSDIAESKNLQADNPWVVISCALMRLKRGDFSVFSSVIEALERYDDIVLAIDVGALFAHAAPRHAMPLLRRVYTPEDLSKHPPLVSQYCQILCHSMMPEHLDEVLRWYAASFEGWVYVDVALYLSHIWEDEPGPIHQGPRLVPDPQYPPPFEQEMRDYEGYERVVREAAARVDPSARYVLGGAPFSVVGLAKRMLAHARAGEDSNRTNFERMVFEANTGISCRDFFTDEENPKFRPLAAMAILEDFLDDPWSDHFVDGERYFFGHPIPD